MKRQLSSWLVVGGALALVSLAAACGSDSNEKKGFPRPANTAALSFTVDDTANKIYPSGSLDWKGNFTYDDTTRLLTLDPTWAAGVGPYPALYDDGPWSEGGHEPAGSVAGDHKLGITAFLPVQSTDTTLEYGARNDTDRTDGGAGWIWIGDNGTLTIPANSTGDFTATGLTLPAFGTVDLRFTINVAQLGGGYTVTSGQTVAVKGAYGAWITVPMVDDGTKGDAHANDGIYTFVLSQNTGAGNLLKYVGLMKSGDHPEFVFVLHGVEYKTGTTALHDGATAEIMPAGGSWTPVTITNVTGGNATISVP